MVELFTYFSLIGPFAIYWIIVGMLGINAIRDEEYGREGNDLMLLWAYGIQSVLYSFL